jgi:hypothetical protein
MNATALRLDRLTARVAPGALRRGLIAGTAWGVATAAGLVAWRFYNCGIICVDDIVTSGLMSVAAGLVTIGPLAALGRARS